MTKEEIANRIETYISHNKTKELEQISFKNVFGDNYDSQRLHEVIGKEIPSITINKEVYYLGSWNVNDGFFYFKMKK